MKSHISFSIARQLHAHRTRDEIVNLLTVATANCGRNVPHREIVAAVDDAEKVKWQATNTPCTPAQSRAWPEVNTKARSEIVKDGGGLVDLWEASPVRIDSNEPQSEEIIDRLFPGNPLLCVGASSYSFDTKPRNVRR